MVALYALASHRELNLEEKLLAGLSIGAERFAMPIGLITRIDGESCQLEYVLSLDTIFVQGQKCALNTGFCGRV